MMVNGLSGCSHTERWRMRFSQGAWFLLLAGFLVASVNATVDEGTALRTMMLKWKVNFPSWQGGEDPCASSIQWQNVSCKQGHVFYLNVSSTGLAGVLPDEVGQLTALEILDISNNRMSKGPDNYMTPGGTGEALPASLAQCTKLRSLNLSNIGWNLAFPTVVTQLPLLEEIYMAQANLSGTIPDSFFELSNLKSVFLGATEGSAGLTGDLKGFANLKELVYLSIFRNPFNSPFYEELGTLTKLKYFNCQTCGLYGGLPESFGYLPDLQNLTINRNQLSGRIPNSWRNMTNMRNLRFDTNSILGEFPIWMMDFPLLDSLFLSRNLFYGPVPYSIAQFETRYNITNKYNILRWDCNYLDSDYEPCVSPQNPCSAPLLRRYGIDVNNSFVFSPNCYGDATKQERDSVQQCTSSGHTLDCGAFNTLVIQNNQCPPCPGAQVLLNGQNDASCICTMSTGSSDGGNGLPVGAVAGGVVALVVVFILLLALVMWWRRKQFSFLDIFNPKRAIDEHWEVPSGVQRFTVKDLARITNDFSDDHVIGSGGFGKVYRGTLEDGRIVAIKRAGSGSLQGVSEFRNEISLLSRLHARHLVKLEGFCDEEHFQCLVYEFMKNGNLHTHLLRKGTTTPLSWAKRVEIAYGIAQGLEYLHSFADPPVIHRDVKPANILLDGNMVAKLADFGISKESPDIDTHVSTKPAGTAGYLDPDYFLRRQLTTASDVYAYGVVMLELVTGQAAIDQERHEEYNLVEWVKKRFKTAGIVSVVDPLMESDYPVGVLSTMAELGLECASFDRSARPSMKTVLTILEKFQSILPDLNKKSEREIAYEKKMKDIATSPLYKDKEDPEAPTDPEAFGLSGEMLPR